MLPLIADVFHGFFGSQDVVLEGPFGADVAAVGDAELLLDVVLGWETVAVPTPDTFDVLAVHGLVAADGVLNGGA